MASEFKAARMDREEVEGDLALARDVLRSQGLTFVMVKGGRVLGSGCAEGVEELLELVDRWREESQGSSLADKVVGKAVAMIARWARLAAVYASLMSEVAREELRKGGILATWEELVPLIFNQSGTGPCPLEKAVLPLTSPESAVASLRALVAQKHGG